jgi:hypothetical protein
LNISNPQNHDWGILKYPLSQYSNSRVIDISYKEVYEKEYDIEIISNLTIFSDISTILNDWFGFLNWGYKDIKDELYWIWNDIDIVQSIWLYISNPIFISDQVLYKWILWIH